MPSVEDYARFLTQGRRFAQIKVNHGYWECLVRADRLMRSGVIAPKEIDEQLGRPFLFETNYPDEFAALLRQLPKMSKDIYFSASPYSFPGSQQYVGVPREGLTATEAMIERHVPTSCNTGDALDWKQAVYDGSIVDVLHALRDRNVVLIGPSWLDRFGSFVALPSFRHVSIPERGAIGERHDFRARMIADYGQERDLVFLIQAGSYSPWLVLELFEALNHASFLDFGTVLNLCYFPRISKQTWSRIRSRDVARTVAAVNPEWPTDARFFLPGASETGRAASWSAFRDGISPQLAEFCNLPPRTPTDQDLDRPDLESVPAQFIENKKIDLARVEAILSLSRATNRWTNFGPVAEALEKALAHLLRLPPGMSCVVCNSATTALSAIAGLYAVKSGRPLRWVTSAFGFQSLNIGPLAGAIAHVDCNRHGAIRLKEVAALPSDAWDGLIVTNVFGGEKHYGRYVKFARERGKALIVDGALAFPGPDRSARAGVCEAISLHQTKPWGMGEGGCAVVPADDAMIVRGFLNYATDLPAFARPFGSNGKLSDFAAATILDRLERLPRWETLYHAQRARLASTAARMGLSILPGIRKKMAIASNVPFLAGGPVDLDDLPQQPFTVRKYYRPLATDRPMAESIYRRIVNVPCHPGMAAVPTEALERFFAHLAAIPGAPPQRKMCRP